MKNARGRPGGVSLRWLLTVSFSMLLGAVFLLIGVFVYESLQGTMLALVDRSLKTALDQALDDVDYVDGRPVFSDEDEEEGDEPDPLDARDWYTTPAIRIVSRDGAVLSSSRGELDLPNWPVSAEGVSTRAARGEQWRIVSRPLKVPAGGSEEWLQAIQTLRFMEETLGGLLRFILAGFPALLIASAVAVFVLSSRALLPVIGIARTAASIGEGDLTRRTGYRGRISEVADLARSFDRMLETIQDAFERERRFTSDAAHELRTPLTALKGQIEVAGQKTRSAAQHERTLRSLQQQVDRLIRLANDLLFMSRLEAGIPRDAAVRVSLGELLESLAEQAGPLLKGRQLGLSLHDGAEVLGDMDQLIRLFLNLLENAAKFSPQDGAVDVELTRSDGVARVSISNTGEGIPEEHLSRVFDRFYKVRSDRSREAGGSGLGLSIAREIARKHGGDISVMSEVGCRTTFTVVLPTRPPAESA